MTNAKNSPTPPFLDPEFLAERRKVVGDYVASAIVQSLLHHPTLHPLSLLTYRPIFVLLLASLPNSWIFLGSRKELHILSPEILPYFCSPPNFPTQRYFWFNKGTSPPLSWHIALFLFYPWLPNSRIYFGLPKNFTCLSCISSWVCFDVFFLY